MGTVVLNRRDQARLGHITPNGEELEISYTFLPQHWGHGYATEAVEAVLAWASTALADPIVVLCTQTANQRSVRLGIRFGFEVADRFEEFSAEQWFGVRGLAHPTAAPR